MRRTCIPEKLSSIMKQCHYGMKIITASQIYNAMDHG
jgi:hypothetical protein